MLILRHPQEAKRPLGTARLTALALPKAKLLTGLSWRSLSQALGDQVDPKRWAVLFLGSLKDSEALPQDVPLQIRGRNGQAIDLKTIEGIVLLDGNWKQSKTLWWRNAWLLKLNRILLNPNHRSQYGTLRKEPRKNCLSTIEATAESLEALGEDAAVGTGLNTLFTRFLEKARVGV